MFQLAIIFVLFFLSLNADNNVKDDSILFIVSYDAFRYNYISKDLTPTLAKLKAEGCTADYLENVFITKTFTNHMSIATGLFASAHGVMGNSIYDPKLKKRLDYSYELFHYNEDVRPLWIENELRGNGRHSGVMMWPGGEFNYSGIHPTWNQPWSMSMTGQQRVDMALSWVQDKNKPANLIMMYIEEPDSHSHAFGPDSPQSKATIQAMDTLTKYLLDRLEATGLKSRTNLFLISDHGMQTITPADFIDLGKYVSDDLYEIFEASPTLHIMPKPGKAVEVHTKLMNAATTVGGFKVYKPQQLFPRWHYLNDRTPPLLVVADPPHVFQDFQKSVKFYEKNFNVTVTPTTTFGVHGYDNISPNMRPYFIALGPDIKSATKVDPFRTVDLFGIWAQLLGFPDAVGRTNGTVAPIRAVLKPPSSATPKHDLSLASVAAILFGVSLVITAMLGTVYLSHRRLRKKYYTLLRTEEAGDESSQRLLTGDEELT